MNKRTKALAITQATKKKVHERQNGVSIFSGVPITISECCCHLVPRSKGGLGIEQNILGMTYNEHMLFDNNVINASKEVSDKMREIAIKHLKEHYTDWNIEDVTYKK